MKLGEALDDRASIRRSCGFPANEATPEQTAFVRFRRRLVARKLNQTLVETVAMQLKAKAVTVKTRTLVNATIIASASEDNGDALSETQGEASCSRLQGPRRTSDSIGSPLSFAADPAMGLQPAFVALATIGQSAQTSEAALSSLTTSRSMRPSVIARAIGDFTLAKEPEGPADRNAALVDKARDRDAGCALSSAVGRALRT